MIREKRWGNAFLDYSYKWHLQCWMNTVTCNWLFHHWKNLHSGEGDLGLPLSSQKRQRKELLSCYILLSKIFPPGTSVSSWPLQLCQSPSLNCHIFICIFSKLSLAKISDVSETFSVWVPPIWLALQKFSEMS